MNERSKRRVALITGVTGQDGAYLAKHLLRLGCTVHGIKRRLSLTPRAPMALRENCSTSTGWRNWARAPRQVRCDEHICLC